MAKKSKKAKKFKLTKKQIAEGEQLSEEALEAGVWFF
jgi:hypothetical protein